MSTENVAREANSPKKWDDLWRDEGDESWRKEALKKVYDRIEFLLPKKARVTDIGGGVGLLGRQLAKKAGRVRVWDHSKEAIKQAIVAGLDGTVVDLEKILTPFPSDPSTDEVVVATEVLEHLSPEARERVLSYASKAGRAFFSVPNDRLGPEEEPQHTIQFSAMSFKRLLKQYFLDVRIEVLGPKADPHGEPAFLLAVCGFPKPFTLSMTMPVRDEAADVGKTLASFRGAADEIVVGIDPRTKDHTWAVCERYADKIFFLEDPEGPIPGKEYHGVRAGGVMKGQKRVPDGGVHFAWVRNQCMDECTSDWIFMTEGHEPLAEGQDTLLNLDQLDESVKIGLVWRSDPVQGQRWAFAWLTKNNPKIHYIRATHNTPDYPEGYHVVKLPQVRTSHERVHARSVERAAQRKIQNRITLMDDWVTNGSTFSKYYLASEWRDYDPARAEQHFREFLAMPSKHGDMRYQSRLILAKMLRLKGDNAGARKVLLDCTEDDWQRIEHWVWLGDMAMQDEQYEQALQFYLYSSTRMGNPPFTLWWIEMAYYSYLPAQRLAIVYGELGQVEKALFWAKQALEHIPEGSPEELFEEAKENIAIIEEALNEPAS